MRRLRFPWHSWSFLIALTLALAPFVTAAHSSGVRADAVGTRVYTNPLPIQIPGDGVVQSCADPSIIHAQPPDTAWYIYCTTDPLNDNDGSTGPNGQFLYNFHLISMHKS